MRLVLCPQCSHSYSKAAGGRPSPAQPQLADVGTGTWQLVACGHTVTLHATDAELESFDGAAGGGGLWKGDNHPAAPFDRLVCDDEQARERVERVIALARGATAPIML